MNTIITNEDEDVVTDTPPVEGGADASTETDTDTSTDGGDKPEGGADTSTDGGDDDKPAE